LFHQCCFICVVFESSLMSMIKTSEAHSAPWSALTVVLIEPDCPKISCWLWCQRDDERSKDRERGKSRNIDHFMEELKREQEAREKRTADREQRRSDRKSQAAGMVASYTWCDNASRCRKILLHVVWLEIQSLQSYFKMMQSTRVELFCLQSLIPCCCLVAFWFPGLCGNLVMECFACCLFHCYFLTELVWWSLRVCSLIWLHIKQTRC
jgi:hypothetical protein